MIKFVLLIVLLFGVFISNAQQPAILWNQHFGGTLDDEGLSIAGDKHDGGFIIASISNSTDDDIICNSTGDNVAFLMKFDSNHNLIWKNCYEGAVYSINATNDGGYIFAGLSDSTLGAVNCNHGAQDFWVVKIDSLGNVKWSKCYGGSSTDIAYSVIQTKDGKYIAAGFSDSDDGDVGYHYGSVFNDNVWIIKLDSTGNLIWSKVIGDSTYGYDANAVMQDSEGNYVVAGDFQNSFNGISEALLIKLDTAGNIIGEYGYGGTDGYSSALAIVEASDHNYVFAGVTTADNGESSGNHGMQDFWFVKVDTAGNFIWSHCYGGSNDDEAFALCNTLDNGFALAGETASSDGQVTNYHGSNDYWIVKTDSAGNLTWERDLGGSYQDIAEGIFQRDDGNYFITGSSDSQNGDFDTVYSPFEQDIWVTELAEFTGINQLSINNIHFSIYPNPALSQTTVLYSVPQSTQQVNLFVYDITGRTIEQLPLNKYSNQATLDVGNLAAGMYLVELKTDEGMVVKKLVVE